MRRERVFINNDDSSSVTEERPYAIPVGAAYGVLFGVLGATFLHGSGSLQKKGLGLQGVLRPTDDGLIRKK